MIIIEAISWYFILASAAVTLVMIPCGLALAFLAAERKVEGHFRNEE